MSNQQSYGGAQQSEKPVDRRDRPRVVAYDPHFPAILAAASVEAATAKAEVRHTVYSPHFHVARG